MVGVQRGVYHQQSQARAKADLQAIANAMDTFKLRYGDYPWEGEDNTSTTGGQQAKDLFKVLTGQRVLKKSGGNYTMVDLGDDETVSPLIDESMIEVNNADNPEYFIDPWGSPYKFYYKTAADDDWDHTGFILLSMGPDRDMDTGDYDFAEGEFPQNSEQYYGDPEDTNFDNLVYGLEVH